VSNSSATQNCETAVVGQWLNSIYVDKDVFYYVQTGGDDVM